MRPFSYEEKGSAAPPPHFLRRAPIPPSPPKNLAFSLQKAYNGLGKPNGT